MALQVCNRASSESRHVQGGREYLVSEQAHGSDHLVVESHVATSLLHLVHLHPSLFIQLSPQLGHCSPR